MDPALIINNKQKFWYPLALLIIAFEAIGMYLYDWPGGMVVIAVGLAILLLLIIFRRPFIGLLAIVVALPFEYYGSLEIGGLTLRVSQVLLVVTLIAWLADGLARRRLLIRRQPLLIPIVILLLINILSLTQAVNLQRGLVYLVATVITMVFGLLIAQLLTNKKQAVLVVRVLLIITFLVTAFGLFQFVGDLIGLPQSLTGLREQYTKEVFGFPRIQGTALEPLYFVNFLILPLTLAFAFLLSREKVMSTLWLSAIFLLGVINVVLALSRAGYVAVAVSLFIVGAYYIKKLLTPRQFIIALLVVLITTAVFIRVFGLTEDTDISLSKFSHHAVNVFEGASYSDRVTTYTYAWDLFREHPWLGIGIGNFGPVVAAQPLIEPVTGWLIVNNIFLEIATEIGIFGLLTFLLMLLLLFLRSLKALRATAPGWLRTALIGSLAAFIGVLVQYQTFSILFIMHIWFLFGWLIALQNLALVKEKT
ncbi:MAG: O-antigen ligase family protein [Patescibacteria group bacterium]